MTNFEDTMAVELSDAELNEVAGGAYKPLPAKAGFKVYKIQRGDNLTKIARAHKCTVNDLLAWNPKIKNRNLIYAGDYLYIKL